MTNPTRNDPLLDPLVHSELLAAQIAHTETFEPREAQLAVPSSPMHPLLSERLVKMGLEKLYTHQASAYDAAMQGKDVVVVTGTNSGKTMCYNLPAIQWSLAEPAARMFYLFPTKALAQDQLGKLDELIPGPQIKAATYDGDTSPGQRSSIRRMAHIVLTNPDMLHVGILPGHENWTRFLKSLRLIVLDEMHVYRGVFGSHVANIIRRLLRLCEWHRSYPQIIACSATIGNPDDLFEKLTGRKALLIDQDGSPKARRTFIFWNPPEIGEGVRMSANVVTSEIVGTLAESGLRSLAFNRSRIGAELVLRYTRGRLKNGGLVDPAKIESYRAGYTAKERRQIEKGLFKGDLLALSATNAMELGVDVGGLDAVVMNGYPGTISSFFQQAGRAGRGTRDGLAIMVANDDPLEQFLVRKPDMILRGANESVALNPQNPQILSAQLLCAAHERPISMSELERFGPTALDTAESLDRSGELSFRAGAFYYPSHEPPAFRVNIRGTGGDEVQLVVDNNVLGSMERWRAMQNAHTGAVYLHRGQSYVVQSLDLEIGRAELRPQETSYYTRPTVQSILQQTLELQASQTGKYKVSLTGVKVTTMVIGFTRKSLDGERVLDMEGLDMPATTYDTLAVRFDLPAMDHDEEPQPHLGAIHGLEHALMAVAPILAGCDRGDLGSTWYSVAPDTLQPAVYAFDQTPGGVGLCEKLFDNTGRWIVAAYQLLSTCECIEGCPACLMSARCESMNEVLNKKGAIGHLTELSP